VHPVPYDCSNLTGNEPELLQIPPELLTPISAEPVLVTGATGFIGRHLREVMTSSGIRTALLTRRPTDALANETHFSHVNTASRLKETVKTTRASTLIHLEWSGLPNYGSPAHLKEELPRQLNLLTEAMESGIARLVIAGTCEEYGDRRGLVSESDECLPMSNYAKAKSCLYAELRRLAEPRRATVIWARLFYVYGDGQRRGSLFDQLRLAAGYDQGFVALRNPRAIRDFIDVRTVARTLAFLGLRASGLEVVNVGSGHGVTVRRHALELIERNNWNIRLLDAITEDEDGPGFWADVQRLKAEITRCAIAERSIQPLKTQY